MPTPTPPDRSSPGSSGSPGPESLLAEYLARREDGLDFEEWVQSHPEHEAELRRLRDGYSSFERKLVPQLFDEDGRRGYFYRYGGASVADVRGPLTGAVARDDVVGDFRLVRPLGAGGMGIVWEAEELSLGRRVALKLLQEGTSLIGRRAERLSREARAAARLNHPHIVSVHAFGESEDQIFIAQELVEGGCSLADFLDDMRHQDARPAEYYTHVAELVAKVADALEVAHQSQVIHRDVKPQNILITQSDEPKVCDFGLAYLQDDIELSRTGEVAGTYCYMSPEQATGKKIDVDHRTDIFSLGTTLYELLTLKRAFQGDSGPEVTERILFHEPPAAREVVPDVPRDLSIICAVAMEKLRGDRYETMGELAADLRRFLAHEPIHASPPGPARRAVKWVRRHPTLSAAAALTLVSLLVVAGLFGENVDALAAKNRAQRDGHLITAQLDFLMGEFTRGEQEIDRALEVSPGDPLPHLVLAEAHTRQGRFQKGSEAVDRALAEGFVPEEPRDASAMELLGLGLFRIARDKSAGYQDAERLLVRAVELDPRLKGAWYPIFRVRKELGDADGARAALLEFRDALTRGDPFGEVVEARLEELDGDHAAAIARLEALRDRDDVTEERWREMRVDRDLGRNLLALRRYEEALVPLRASLEVEPRDAWTLANAIGALLATERTGTREQLTEAQELTERLRSQDPDALVLTAVELDRDVWNLLGTVPRPAPDEEVWRSLAARVTTALERVAEGSSTDLYLRALAGDLHFAHASELWGVDDPRAGAAFRRAFEANDRHVRARFYHAQARYFDGDHEAAFKELEGARVRFDELAALDADGLALLLPSTADWVAGRVDVDGLHSVLQVWLFVVAVELDEERALACREDAYAALARGLAIEEALSLAEACSRAPGAAHDCATATSILESTRARELYPDVPAIIELIAGIEDRCP